MPYVFLNPVTRGNEIKYNGDHFCNAFHKLQRFCNTLFYNFYKQEKQTIQKCLNFIGLFTWFFFKQNKVHNTKKLQIQYLPLAIKKNLKIESETLKKNKIYIRFFYLLFFKSDLFCHILNGIAQGFSINGIYVIFTNYTFEILGGQPNQG